jgi:hypothetical protein
MAQDRRRVVQLPQRAVDYTFVEVSLTSASSSRKIKMFRSSQVSSRQQRIHFVHKEQLQWSHSNLYQTTSPHLCNISLREQQSRLSI